MIQEKDTIAAIATAYGKASVGIVRISGKDAIEISNKIWESDVSKYKTHTAHYGKIKYDNKIIDEAILLVMKGPNSYTGEDVVEIQSHGGSFVVSKILKIVLDCGARIADPGEFTKRAFLNGKMDLTQAEGVMDIIGSSSEFSRKSAISLLEGKLGKKVREFRKIILHNTAFIETALDDPEHMDVTGYGETLEKEINPIIEEIEKLIESWDDGRILKEGIRTAIIGKPNAGKSSLMNALLEKERAIVTNIPGTTRDTIEENVNIGGITLNMIDTAGIRKTEDKIEQIGVEKAIKEYKEADLVLHLVSSEELLNVVNESNDEKNISNIFNVSNNNNDEINLDKIILIINKIDLLKKEEIEKINNFFENNLYKNRTLISAKEGINIDELKNIIKEMFIKGNLDNNDELIITNIRHKEALIRTKESLDKVIDSIKQGLPEDFYSIDLIDAYDYLGKITGETTDEDLVNEIFSKFCVGK